MRKSKTSAPQGVELRQSLLSETSTARGLTLTKEQLCDLFHPDNIKNIQEGSKISVSLHKYWHELMGSTGLSNGLNTNVKSGIEGDARDIKAREKKYGQNFKRPPKIRSLFELILENFEDRILQILLIAATVALVVGIVQHGWAMGWVEGTSIYIAVCLIVTVTAGNNYIKEKQFQKLVSKAAEQDIAVFRGREGLTTTIPIQKLVVGDIIKIEAGMSIPADCVLIESIDVSCDEASLTGEPEQVEKQKVTDSTVGSNPNPFLLAKTLVVQGQGAAIVCAVGTNTRSGMAEEKLNIEEEETPLQAKLETIANEIGKIGVYVAILTFIAMTVNLIVSTLYKGDTSLVSVETLNKLVGFLIVAITVIVVAVPEGLPLAVTISLAFSVMKMKQENNLVRKLEASETMGGACEICTDKTGTLTKNNMTVQEFYTAEQIFDATSRNDINFTKINTHVLLTEGVLFNCSARIEKSQTGVYEAKGNCTEVGLINLLMFAGVNVAEEIKKKNDRVLEVIPFNSSRKRACCVVRHPDNDHLVRVFLKGAPEIVLDYCTKHINKQGEIVDLSEDKKQEIITGVISNNFAKKAYRTLLISYRDYSFDEYLKIKAQNNDFQNERDREALESQMVVIGIYALMDPLRDEIVESAIKCRKAGINIRMVTGDNIDTAKAIALKAGILTEEEAKHEYACLDGKTFREICGGLKKLDDPNDTGKLREEVGNKKVFRDVEKRLKVLARSTPEDKYMLVTGLKELGRVVAVTGDGTNDAPALKKADVGFAMGITGTEVAKEASDIILLDDNFASIVTAVKWGRNIYTNVRKFLQFQLTVNCVAMFIVFLGGVVVAQPPLTSVQMLWVNLIMDTFAALALATEPPSDDLLEQQPYGRNDIIVTPVMWRNIIGQGIYQATILVIMLFAGGDIFGMPFGDTDPFYYPITGAGTNRLYVYTMIFHTFVFMQVFNEINSRKLGDQDYNVFAGFFNNWLFISIIILTIGVQVCMVEYGGLPVQCAPLSIEHHIVCISIGAFSLIQAILVKAFLPVRWFARLHMKEEAMSDEEEKDAFTTQFRKSFRASHRRSTQKVNIQ